MKKAILFMFILLLTPIVVSAEDILGSKCSGSIMDIDKHESCRQQTNFIIWSNTLSDSCDFVMKSVGISSRGYLDIDDADDLPGELKSLKNQVGVIAGSLIVFALTYSGLMYIISPTDPKRRNAAKGYMISCIYMLVFVVAISYVSWLAYDLSFKSASMVDSNIDSFLTKSPWTKYAASGGPQGTDSLDSAYSKFNSIVQVAPVFLIVGWVYIILMYLRNMIIMLLTVLASLLVFLFFFKPTRAFGTILLALYGVELFVPVLFFPVFKVAGTMFTGDAKIDIGIMASALGAAIILHIVLVAVAIVKSSAVRWSDD